MVTRSMMRPRTGDDVHGEVTIETLPRHMREAATQLWESVGLTRPWNDPTGDLNRALESPSSTVLAAVSGSDLQGTVMVGHDGHRGWMYYLAVDPAFRGVGVGTRLVRAAESWLRWQNVPKAQLMIRQSNASVVGFYEGLGYADQPVIVMGRSLAEGDSEAHSSA